MNFLLTGRVALSLCAALPMMAGVAALHAMTPERAAIDRLAQLSVPFVPNAGQWDSRAAFAAHTFAGTLYVTTDGQLVYSLPGKRGKADDIESRELGANAGQRTPGWVLTEQLVDRDGARRRAAPQGSQRHSARVGYFLGSDAQQHRPDVATYGVVSLGDVYPGIALSLRATGNNVEKIFTVAPQHDPGQIRIDLGGATALSLGSGGEMIASTDNGAVSFTAPIAFQHDDTGQRVPVAVRYALDASKRRYGFELAAYDRTRPLVIDPLLQSTYLGAAGADTSRGVAVHPATGDVYVVGTTDATSNTFPGVTGGAQGTNGGSTDIFVARFSADLSTLLRSTYLGSTDGDSARGIAIHPATGDVYVVGLTAATVGVTFPGVAGSAQPGAGGGFDAVISRLTADLTTLVRSTYLGAAGSDTAEAIAIHPITGDVYVAGNTTSGASSFPGVGTGAQPVYANAIDGFVARTNAELTTPWSSTYLGAGNNDRISALAIHPATGEVLVAGDTNAPGSTFPGVAGGAVPTASGGFDAFVTRLSASLSTILQSTYVGGPGNDYGYAVAAHPFTGEIVVAGRTASASGLPALADGAQSVAGGFDDAFVTLFSPDLTRVVRSTYLGSSGTDYASALAIHPTTGEIYVSGLTSSVGSTFPGVAGGVQSVNAGGDYDAFVSRLSADLKSLLRSTYLGASGSDSATSLALRAASGVVYIAGITTSAGASFPGVAGGAQATSAGGDSDAFVARLTADLTASDTTPDPFAFASQLNVPLASVRTSAPALISGLSASAVIYVDGTFGSQYCVSSASNCSCDLSGNAFTSVAGNIANNSYLCVRHTSAPVADEIRRSRVHVGAAAATFTSTTGTGFTSCNLDIDGSGGAPNAASDGLMLVRAMLGFTGTSVTNGAIIGTPPRNTWALIRQYLNDNCGTSFAP